MTQTLIDRYLCEQTEGTDLKLLWGFEWLSVYRVDYNFLLNMTLEQVLQRQIRFRSSGNEESEHREETEKTWKQGI